MTTATVPASVFLDKTLSTAGLNQVARAIHEQWYRAREEDLSNPNNPFLGNTAGFSGTNQLLVGDCQLDRLMEAMERGGKPRNTAHSGRSMVVYDPLFVANFDHLPVIQRALKILPVQSLCFALGDFILPAGTTVADLALALVGLIRGTTHRECVMVNKLHHAAVQAFRLAQDAQLDGQRIPLGLPIYESMPDSGYRLSPESLAAAGALLTIANAQQ
jgi:hypothetical protein